VKTEKCNNENHENFFPKSVFFWLAHRQTGGGWVETEAEVLQKAGGGFGQCRFLKHHF